MSRIPCNVNKDLLPLYVDDVCSEESKAIVEEHLAGCEECQDYFDVLQEGIAEEKMKEKREEFLSEEKMNREAVSVIKSLKKEISKSGTKRTAVAVAALLLVLFMLEGLSGSYMGGWLGEISVFDVRLKTEDVRVTEMYLLENGYLYVSVEPDKKCSMYYTCNVMETFAEEDGFTGEYEGYFWLENTPLDWDSIPIRKLSCIFPLSRRVKEDAYGNIKEREDSVIYLMGKGGEKIPIWEKGQEVKKAPPEIEDRARKEIEEKDAEMGEKMRKGEAEVIDVINNVYTIAELESQESH